MTKRKSTPKNREAVTEANLGSQILQTISRVLERSEKAGERLGYPGEGGERRFRAWLASDLLIGLLKWPSEKVVVGERFDVILQDADDFAVVTVETKTPYKKASEDEKADFKERLSGFGTLRTAYFTNGVTWDRLDISSPTGTLEIHAHEGIDIRRTTSEEAEAFFALLRADRYFGIVPVERNQSRVVRSNTHILEALASDLNLIVAELAQFYGRLFRHFDEGRTGHGVQGVTRTLFDQWCEKSLIVSPTECGRRMRAVLTKGDVTPREIARALQEMGFSQQQSSASADTLASVPIDQRPDDTLIRERLGGLYRDSVSKLCAQTAHVILARALLYRAGEDANIFLRLLSGNPLREALTSPRTGIGSEPLPASELLANVARRMQTLVPSVYKLGEFDWWLVPNDKRTLLSATEQSSLSVYDKEHEVVLSKGLRILNGYSFSDVDVDVWRNVYQHYLPAEERQRLGGFYTPDELVDLILDLSGYDSATEGLCKQSFIDPACGSGAFVTACLGRLLVHLQADMPCHQSNGRAREPKWKRAERILRTVSEVLHAVDIHPFASFLTTLNVTFVLLPLYVRAREKNPDYTLDLQIFSADSLEKPDPELHTPDFFATLNSRIQLSEDAIRHYLRLLDRRFDYVFGNPPWGGVLKGSLAPVFDEAKKRRFKQEYPAAAQGKYDVYGLFMERGLGVLTPGGRLGMVTQGTFIDKEWAKGLRKKLADNAECQVIVDLNPFGQLFFGRMNTPAVSVWANKKGASGKVIVLLSSSFAWKKGTREIERRKRVVTVVREALARASKQKSRVKVDFASACLKLRTELVATAATRWDLSCAPAPQVSRAWPSITELLEPRQGVTPGGVLDVFLLLKDDVRRLGLESRLTRKAIKSREIKRWKFSWQDRFLLYPYLVRRGEAIPAFDALLARTERTRDLLVTTKDVLEFDIILDSREREIRRGRPLDQATLEQLLEHRIGLGLVQFPATARYLVSNFDVLEGRQFKKQNIRDFGRRWYEYLWPRDQALMLGTERIVSPSLVRAGELRFALDSEGFLSDHACQYLFPTQKTARRSEEFRKVLSETLGRPVSTLDFLRYCLAFLNSMYARERLVSGRRPTPKGSYQISEEYLREIPVLPPRSRAQAEAILLAVERLTSGLDGREEVREEERLSQIISNLLGSSG